MSIEAVAASASPGRYARGRKRREEIVRGASEMFAERGFTNATILDIAAACGITRAGLLYYFPDKEHLLEAVLEDRDAEDQRRFEPYTRIRGGVGVLRGMVDLAEHNRLVPGLIDLFVRLSTEASDPTHPAHTYFVERYERIRTGTARALRAAARAGYLRADVDAVDAALRLTALMDGLQAQWLLDTRIEMSRHIRAAVQELLTPAGAQALAEISMPPVEVD